MYQALGFRHQVRGHLPFSPFYRAPHPGCGFSLVELSIVLVILGLLTGGILAGQSLIRAAELRSVVSDYQRYSAAIYGFRDRFRALPGDFKNATKFWGDNNAACADASTTDGTPGTCNGDGDGVIAMAASAAGGTGEPFQFWTQLALAGLIEGSYTGLAGAAGTRDHDRGINCPAGRMSDTLWGSTYYDNASGSNSVRFARDYRNSLLFGVDDDNVHADGQALLPEEVWNIDHKLDDGKPASGFVVCAYVPNCTASGTSNTDLSASYDLTATSKTWVHFLPR